MSHHHTYYVTSSYILCHIIIQTERNKLKFEEEYAIFNTAIRLCHIIIHTMSHHMSHHHTYYVTSWRRIRNIQHSNTPVTSSYILCHIIIHTKSHHHTNNLKKNTQYSTQQYACPKDQWTEHERQHAASQRRAHRLWHPTRMRTIGVCLSKIIASGTLRVRVQLVCA